MKGSTVVQGVLGVGLLLLSLSHWLPLGINLLELLGAFAHFTLAISVGVFGFSILRKLPVLASAAFVSMVICGTLVVPHFSLLKSSEEAHFTVGQFNVYHLNGTPEAAIEVLLKANADIFTVQELNTAWRPLTDSLLGNEYPFRVEEFHDDCCYGIGLYSKHPIIQQRVFDSEGVPAIEVTVLVDQRPVRLILFHTWTPAFPNETAARNRQLAAVAEMARAGTGATVVMGDLNVVPWDGVFKDFLEKGKLTAVRDGFQATFPMDLGFPLIPIDHITYSANLVPTSCETVTIPGSDHRGLVAGFRFVE